MIIDTQRPSVQLSASVREGQLDDRICDKRDLLPRYTPNIWLLSISRFSILLSAIGGKTRVQRKQLRSRHFYGNSVGDIIFRIKLARWKGPKHEQWQRTGDQIAGTIIMMTMRRELWIRSNERDTIEAFESVKPNFSPP